MPSEELPNPHPDTDPLGDMVARYASKERRRYGTVIDPGPGGSTALRELLLEIDQTMLPRRIHVQCPPKGELTLFVSNRRLFDVSERGAPSVPVPQAPKDAAQVFASILRKVTCNADGLVLQEPQALVQFDEVGVSVSTALLTSVLDLGDTIEPSPQQDSLGDDFTPIERVARASLFAKPCLSVARTRGNEDDLAQLQSFWRSYVERTGLKSTRGRIKHHSQECISIPINRDTHLVVATKDEAIWCLALVPRARLQDLAAVWGEGPS